MKKQAKRNLIARQKASQKRQRSEAQHHVAGDHANGFRQQQRGLSQSLDLPADKRELLEQHDGFALLRNALRQLSQERGEWAGYPMPITGSPLVIEPTYPNALALEAIGHDAESLAEMRAEAEFSDGKTILNRFYSWQRRADVYIWRDENGKIDWGLQHRVNSVMMQFNTLGASDAWGIEQEARALQLLAQKLRHRQFKQYLLTGMFLEKSERSGIHYFFRKLRPTIAASFTAGHPWARKQSEELRVLCALCLHPIAHYQGSWAGAMCPTDDILAHLMLMRGDEAMFWRRANQHPAYRPEAGL
ncbi:MAG: hypothetical protein KGO96_10260 [Elusimicrobia bacterium]|nr:hypothetical protein [Elusimicrobiota bacterium]